MKKNSFISKIKYGYLSYVITSIVIVTVVFVGIGVLLLGGFGMISFDSDAARIFCFVIGVFLLLYGIVYPILAIFAIKQYPRYKKLRRMLFNSDYYFMGENDRSYHGHRKGRAAFNAVTLIGDSAVYWVNTKRPKRFWVYTAIIIAGVILLFANIFIIANTLGMDKEISGFILKEKIVFYSFIAVEIVIIIVLFVFAFLIRGLRKKYGMANSNGNNGAQGEENEN